MVPLCREVSEKHSWLTSIHCAAKIGDDTFIGMQALVFKAKVAVEAGAKIIGVDCQGRYVPTGAVLTKQADADALAQITADYVFRDLNAAVIHVNTQLADGYNGKSRASKAP